jgi:glycosyltransferase involved in cell wall biosynthesis
VEVEYKDYFLALGRLAAYKNFDFLIKAFNKSGKTLVIVGTGPEEKTLRALAKDNIKFTGRVSEEMKQALINNCKGVLNPVEDEDLGIVPVEAMAQGKPVLAHNSGGHKETITEGLSGMFFDNFIIEDFIKILDAFESNISNNMYEADKIKESVKNFSKLRFQKEIREFVEKAWENFE